MATSIIEQATAAESTRSAALLRSYRELLATDKPKDADALLNVARQLGFSLDRMRRDIEVIASEKRLQSQAADLADAKAEHETASEAAQKHADKMQKAVAKLQAEQSQLDAAESSARGRVHRAESAARELDTLHAEQSELFGDIVEAKAAVERQRLQALADELPGLHQQLAEAEARVAELNAAFEEAAYTTSRCTPGSDGQREAIAKRDEIGSRRNEAVGIVAELHDRIDERESARRTILRNQGGADSE